MRNQCQEVDYHVLVRDKFGIVNITIKGYQLRKLMYLYIIPKINVQHIIYYNNVYGYSYLLRVYKFLSF